MILFGPVAQRELSHSLCPVHLFIDNAPGLNGVREKQAETVASIISNSIGSLYHHVCTQLTRVPKEFQIHDNLNSWMGACVAVTILRMVVA